MNKQNYIAVGLSDEKQLTFEGEAGDYFGALNNGSILMLKGNAGRFIGDTMSNGGIIVQGNVQHGVGLAINGGIIVIRGNVNGDIGQLAKGGTVIISGNAGSRTGAFMYNGELIVVGDIGKDAGMFMNGGTIFVGGKIESLGVNADSREINEQDKIKLKKYFEHYGIINDAKNFKKIVPLDINPWKGRWINLNSPQNMQIDKHKKIKTVDQPLFQSSYPKSLIDEIISKTKDGLVDISESTLPKSYSINYQSGSDYDKLKILPTQTQPVKSVKVFDSDFGTKLTIGSSLQSPLVLDLPFFLSSRGAGIVSKSSKMAYIYASAKLNTAVNTGGTTLPEELELSSKYKGKLIHQWNIGRFGVDVEYLNKASAIEIVIGNGGVGSLAPIIPSEKINDELVGVWKIKPNTNVILPPKMFDFDVPADLKRHVELLREVNNHKIPIIIKLASSDVYNDVKLALRASPDAIVIEGIDTNNQNSLPIVTQNVGLPSIAAIPPAVRAFKDTRADKKDIKLIISGMFRSGADVFKALAMGANAVVISSAAEIAIGCDLCGNCNSNICEVGIATTNPKFETKLDWVVAGKKLLNFLTTIDLELKFLMILAGIKNIDELNKNHLRALDYDTAAMTGTQLIGFDKVLPMWEH